MLRSMLEKYGGFNLRSRIFPRPRVANALQFDQIVDTGVLDCYEPQKPFLSRTSPIVTIGSCFARNVALQLLDAGYNVYTAPVTDLLFTPPALLRFTEALRDSVPATQMREYWDINQTDADRMRTLIAEGATVIVTFGLSTVWIDKKTGGMIPDPSSKSVNEHNKGIRTLPDPARYEMRQMGVEAIVEALQGIIKAIREIGTNNKIVLTLSPIPLALSANDQPVFVADCISKSSLRVALDEVMRHRIEDIYYFPSFELLRWFATMVTGIWYEDKLLSHIRHEWIRYTVSKFRQYYCTEPHVALPPFP